MFELTSHDRELVDVAKNTMSKFYRDKKHHVAAALRTKSGRIFTGVNLETSVGRMSVCAESIAIGKAIMEEGEAFDLIVAVRHPKPGGQEQEISVVPPCGICREVLTDFYPDTFVIVPVDGTLKKFQVSDLLPYKYVRAQ